MRQVEHVEPHAVNARQGNELVLVAHVRQRLLETGDSFIVQIFLPVEGWGAVIGKQFARIFCMDGVGKAFSQRQVRGGGFAPHQVSIRGIRQATADRLFNASMGTIETFAGTFPGNKRAVIRVTI